MRTNSSSSRERVSMRSRAALAPVGTLLEDLVLRNALGRRESPDLQIPSVGALPGCVSPLRARGLPEGLWRRAYLGLLEGLYRLPGKPCREEDEGYEGQDQGRCTVQVGRSFFHSKSTTGSP